MFVTPVIWVSLVIAWQNRSLTVTLSGVYLDEFFLLGNSITCQVRENQNEI